MRRVFLRAKMPPLFLCRCSSLFFMLKLYIIIREAIMAKVITIAQQKGGAGKTTLAAHIAVALAQKGNRVAVLDIDPQGSLGHWHGIREEKLGEGYTGLIFNALSG